MTLKPVATSGDVWRFRVGAAGEAAFLRVVLCVKDLGLPRSHPLRFLSSCYLVQLSRHHVLRANSFCARSLLVNGFFLDSPNRWNKSGLVKVSAQPVSLEEVEFPAWFTPSGREIYVYRGQVKVRLSRRVVGDVEKRCEAWLSPVLPEQLAKRVVDAKGRLAIYGFEGHDLRYSERRLEACRITGLDLEEPYLEAASRVRGALTKLKRSVSR